MNISNLNELLQTQMLNEGSTSSVGGFAISLNELKHGFAFFSNDEEAINEAVQKGAFVIISEKKLLPKDKEVFYLYCKDLSQAILKLIRFMCEEKELEFVFCEALALDFCEAFYLEYLSGEIFLDFSKLINAKKKTLFFCDKELYLLRICTHFNKLEACEFALLEHSSLFSTSLICRQMYFKNLALPFVYVPFFASFVNFILERKLTLRIKEKKLDFLQVYFINKNNEMCEFGSSSRAFLLAKNELHFDFLARNLSKIKGFKTAAKNTLFCDFSYSSLEDLKAYKDFRYCLIFENQEEFISFFSQSSDIQPSLF
ncbi:hypothetical protein [Campylobacter sp. MIT 97-5078]|uniref:hypothetical protein n=1 Tax=Campylobacter sp. MIT 97-5078 TaxID=1548153 RepID=UPI0005139343|nr:hypothetical protein [Campylobacter sp. MIT 97-5078]KGI56959.1 hypothetical protein LR59_03750 [Campylobacter sp. MIT 97-5078]TQR28208.1 hypothetical protein DMB91_00690 [Campylobacter sp. MIT 97-5078]